MPVYRYSRSSPIAVLAVVDESLFLMMSLEHGVVVLLMEYWIRGIELLIYYSILNANHMANGAITNIGF